MTKPYEETEEQFIERCMIDPKMIDDYPSKNKRREACENSWKTRSVKEKEDLETKKEEWFDLGV